MGRNWFFSGSTTGAKDSSCLYRLIEMAKACGLNPYHYLHYLFDRIPFANTKANYEAILPQNLTQAGHVLFMFPPPKKL